MSSAFMRVLDLTQQRPILRSRDVTAAGIPRIVLSRMERAGLLTKVGRGLYRRSGTTPAAHGTLAEAALRVPGGVVCLLSALHFHGMLEGGSREVWIAVDPDARRPTVDRPVLRVVRFSGRGRRVGVETHVVEGVPVAITSAARTVVDCFRYRNKIGIDVAVAALRIFRERYRHTKNDLWATARAMRVLSVLAPYLEAIPWSGGPTSPPGP